MPTIDLLLETFQFLNTTRIFDIRPHNYDIYLSLSRFHCDYGTLHSEQDQTELPDECKWGANRCCAVHIDSLSLEGVNRRKADIELCLCLERVKRMFPTVQCETYRFCRDGRAYAAGFRDYDDDKGSLIKPWWLGKHELSPFVQQSSIYVYGQTGSARSNMEGWLEKLFRDCPSIKNIILAGSEEFATCFRHYRDYVDCDKLWKKFIRHIEDPTNNTQCMEARERIDEEWKPVWTSKRPTTTTETTPAVTEQGLDTNTTVGDTISGEIAGLIIPLIIAIATISFMCSNLYLVLTRDRPPKKKPEKPVKETPKTSKTAPVSKTKTPESKSKEVTTKSPETISKSKESAEKLGSAESGTSKSAEAIPRMKP